MSSNVFQEFGASADKKVAFRYISSNLIRFIMFEGFRKYKVGNTGTSPATRGLDIMWKF